MVMNHKNLSELHRQDELDKKGGYANIVLVTISSFCYCVACDGIVHRGHIALCHLSFPSAEIYLYLFIYVLHLSSHCMMNDKMSRTFKNNNQHYRRRCAYRKRGRFVERKGSGVMVVSTAFSAPSFPSPCPAFPFFSQSFFISTIQTQHRSNNREQKGKTKRIA